MAAEHICQGKNQSVMMQAMLSQLTSGKSGAQLGGVPGWPIPEGASLSDLQQQLANAER